LLDAVTDVFSVTAAAWTRCRVVLLTASVAAVLAGCSLPAGPGVAASVSLSGTSGVAAGVPAVLRSGDQAAAATLTDTPPARQLAAMLPLTAQLKDVWGQAKSGRLPQVLAVEGGSPTHDPTPGEVYFWPHTEVIAVYYDDLGQPVPAPGLIRLGVVDTGLEALAGACGRVTVRIDLAATGF
jgi:hypothetical protein